MAPKHLSLVVPTRDTRALTLRCLETVAPEAAGRLLVTASIHAYVGGDPFAGRRGGDPPAGVVPVESLGAYVVVTSNPASIALHERLGFRAVGVFPSVGRKFDRYWDVAWFERPLALPVVTPE